MKRLAPISFLLVLCAGAGVAQASAHYVVPVKIWTDGVQYSYIEVKNGQAFGQPAFGPAVAWEVYDSAGTLLNTGYKPYAGAGLVAGSFALVLTPALSASLGTAGDDATLVPLPLNGQFCLNDTTTGAGSNLRWYCVHWGTVLAANIVKSDAASPWGAFAEDITVGIRPCHEVTRTNSAIGTGGGGTWQGDAKPITLNDSMGNATTFVNPVCGVDAGTDAGVADAGQADAGRTDAGTADAGLRADSGQPAADSGQPAADSGAANGDSGTGPRADGGAAVAGKGCGCGAETSPGFAFIALALLVATIATRQARRRSSQTGSARD